MTKQSTQPGPKTIETFQAQLRDFKARKGSHRSYPAGVIAEMMRDWPILASLIDPLTEIQLKYFWRK